MYFGAHVSTAGGVHTAVTRAADIGADCLQLFTQSPRMWRSRPHPDEDVARFRERRIDTGLKYATAHAIYLINIASQDSELRAKSVEALCATMDAAERLGLDSVVFHPGSAKSATFDDVIDLVVDGLSRALARTENTWLLLENSAGQGGTIGRSVEELARLVDAVDQPDRLGICLDTCHWFVSGVDIRNQQVLDNQLDRVDELIGLDRLHALHINDSATPLGSNRDRHANIGEGELGSGLATFLQHPRLQGLPAILEVPGPGNGPDSDQLQRVRALHGQ